MFGWPPESVRSGWEAHTRAESGWKALREGREWSGGPPEGRVALPEDGKSLLEGREALPEDWEWSEAFPKGREWTGGNLGGQGGPTNGPGVFRRPSQRVGSQ